MLNPDLLVLKGHEVGELLAAREREIMQCVRAAYVAHSEGKSSLPNSLFLRFPEDERNRIIALPAYIGDGFSVAGVKWVSSFPANIEAGLDRASAVVILNSTETGRPEAIIEGSIISAKRTAASAAVAALALHRGSAPPRVGFYGCGLINFEVARFLLAAFPEVGSFAVYDIDAERARQFKSRCARVFGKTDVEVAADARALLRESPLVSMATTAARPHISDPSDFAHGATILHVSLRDLTPEIILSCDNVVDDVDHVCRAQTSVHLAEQLVGNRDFVRCTLADILKGAAAPRASDEGTTIFSPFGLGVLDLAVGKLVCELAARQGYGMRIESFLPAPWAEREA